MRKATGFSLLYTSVAMTAFCMVVSLGVDLGHVQLAKVELRRAADAAARAGAQGLQTDTTFADAKTFALSNRVDASPLTLRNSDIQIGTWSTSSNLFQVVPGGDITNANAVRILAHRGADRGDAVSLDFARALGRRTCDVNAEAIAMINPAVSVDQNVMATANPFLSGMPAGSVASNVNPHNNPDYAGTASNPRQSPQPIGMRISDGQEMTFDSIAGQAQHDPSLGKYDPDGQTGSEGPADIGHNNLTTNGINSYGSTMYNQNGIADVTAPINALVGIFLDDNAPNLSPTPSSLDFSTAASRDFSTLQPQLKQIFFIGDGLDSKNVAQTFKAPKGATRLFLATWDFYEWNNNSGSRNIKVNRKMHISIVK